MSDYVEVGFLVADPYEEFYPLFFKQKDHFGAVSEVVKREKQGCNDVEIFPVFIKKV